MVGTITKLDETTADLRTAFDGLKVGFDGWAPKKFGRRLTGDECLAIGLDEGMVGGEADWQRPAIAATRMAFGAYLRRRGIGRDVTVTERTYRLPEAGWLLVEYQIGERYYRHRSGTGFEERETSLLAGAA